MKWILGLVICGMLQAQLATSPQPAPLPPTPPPPPIILAPPSTVTQQGISQVTYNNGISGSPLQPITPNVGKDGLLWVGQQPPLWPPSYHASLNFAASSTTDNACLYGNNTFTLLVYSVQVSGIQATAGMINVQLIRRSTAASGGTTTNFDVGADDTINYPTSSSTPVGYTSTGPTVGTKVAIIYQHYTGFEAITTATPEDVFVWNDKKPQVLIGPTQGLCINTGNAAITGGTIDINFGFYQIQNMSQ